MTVETKFNVGDYVFVIMENQICNRPIISITVEESRLYGKSIGYRIQSFDWEGSNYYREEECHSSVQGLFDYLLNKYNQETTVEQ